MNPESPNRRKWLRLPNYDYRQPGAYFMTVCTYEMRCFFGSVSGETMALNEFGATVQQEWLRSAEVRPFTELDAFVVMPNHFHGILLINADDANGRSALETGATHRVAGTGQGADRPRGPKSGSVSAIVGQFKSHSTRRINQLRGTPGAPVWKANFHEHIIRSERSLERIREYIDSNPTRWTEDRYLVEEAVLV
jgi:REP element-mobilizing transposase RayT